MRLFRKKKSAAPMTPGTPQEKPGYYVNLFTMLAGFKTMLDNKHLIYPFSGFNNPVFDKTDYQDLTETERQEAEALIDNMIIEILFFQTVTMDKKPGELADMAGTELVTMSARLFQNMPLYGNDITIH